MMTEVRGASNAKAKRELGWPPAHPSWRRGLRGGGVSDADEQLLDELRPVAFAIAYRMLGSVAEAEDVVQEALLRVHRRSRRGERDRVAARLRGDGRHPAGDRRAALGPGAARDLRRRVAARAAACADPRRRPGAAQAEMADSLSLAFLVLLESLSPEQRAVLLLHDVFDYGYGEIAEIVGKSEDNARQLAVRARRHVDERRPRFEASREQPRRARPGASSPPPSDGDLAALESLLADDVVLHGDGGGKVPALARSLHGRGRVARTLRDLGRARARGSPAPRFRAVEVNGQPGALLLDGQGA